MDELLQINGIGQATADALRQAAIGTLADLVAADVNAIENALRAAGLAVGVGRAADWQQQALGLLAAPPPPAPPPPAPPPPAPPPPAPPVGGSPIIIVDIQQLEHDERDRIINRIYVIQRRQIADEDLLDPRLKAELERLLEFSPNLAIARPGVAPMAVAGPAAGTAVANPLYRAVKKALEDSSVRVGDHAEGKMPSQIANPGAQLTVDERLFVAIYGVLARDGIAAQGVSEWSSNINGPTLDRRFHNAVAAARGEYEGNRALFDAVLDVLVDEGEQRVNAEQWARIVQTLANQNVAAADMLLGLKVRSALASQAAGDDATPPSAIEIDLPDLEEQVSVDIVVDNLHAMQAVYFSSMLEELKVYQVVDKLVELFQYGMLPVSKGSAGDKLFKYMKRNVYRFSEVERRNLYARTLGFAGGDASSNPNRDFQMLWMRFISAVSSYTRQANVDTLLRSTTPGRISQEQVRKAGRDLAANLSLYGYGMAYFAATELQNQMNDIISILNESEVRGAYGARDMWGVVDQVAALELGGARDSIRYRTMAMSGAVIIRWLAKKSKTLNSVNIVNVLDVGEILNPAVRPQGVKATVDPYDSDLVNSCERWLAVTGTPDAQVETYSDSFEGPVITSQPVQIPSVARDLLSSVGVSAGYNGRYNGR